MTTTTKSTTARANNEYKNKYNHHHNSSNQRTPTTSPAATTLLPLLCRASIKDVVKSPRPLQGLSPSFSDDPTSPEVSCIGQVKRNNKVIGFPTNHIKLSTTPTTLNHRKFRYTKLKRLFFGKNFSTNTTTNNIPSSCITNTTGGGATGSTNYYYSGRSRRRTKCNDENDHLVPETVNVVEMDPPLPVIKKVQQPGGAREEVNIWKRRAGGFGLKGLEIQQLHTFLTDQTAAPPCFHQPPLYNTTQSSNQK